MKTVTRYAKLLIPSLLLCCIGSIALALSPHQEHVNANVVAAMKDQFVGAVSFDGSPITDVQPVSPCKTNFVTRTASTTIDWTAIANPTSESKLSSYVLSVKTSTTTHRLSAPFNPNNADTQDLDARMDTSVGVLYLNCTANPQ